MPTTPEPAVSEPDVQEPATEPAEVETAEVEMAPGTVKEPVLRVVRRRVAEMARRPEIATERPPSLEELRRYAELAPYAPPEGPGRALGKAYSAAVGVPMAWLFYRLAWVVMHPLRLVAAMATFVAAMFLPYVGPVLRLLVRLVAWPVTGWL